MKKRPRSIKEIDQTVALLPLSGALLLPHTQRPLVIFEPRYLALIEHMLAGERIVGLIQPKDYSEHSPKSRDTPLQNVGCIGYLRAFEEQKDSKYLVVLEGLCRFDFVSDVPSRSAFRMAKVNCEAYQGDFDPEFGEELVNRDEFLRSMRDYARFSNFSFNWDEIESMQTSMLVNMCSILAPYGAVEKQALLEAQSISHRAQTLIALAEMEIASASGSGIQ